MDALSIVVDEVALEGLDGITLPSLWIRLESRQPEFPLKLDEFTKGFIWRSLVNNAELSFYELRVERDDVELFDRFKDIDPETGFETIQNAFAKRTDVYPVHAIPENKDGIQGSCVLFKERKDVTKHVRSKSLTKLVTVQEALERYGRKLVVVASQALRFRTLIGSENDPEVTLTNDSYCVLERIGRGRWQGELQSDLHGGLFKADARKMHYLRKSLVQHQLITMQSYIRRLKTGQQQRSILLLLKRFHLNRRTKYDILMEHISTFLQQSPDQSTTVDNLKEELNLSEKTLKRLLRNLRYSKLVAFFQQPIEDLDPSAEVCTSKNGSKVFVRWIRLLKPYGKKTAADFDDDEDDEDDYTEGGQRGLPSEGRIMERDVLSQAYHIILSSGTKGVPQREIGWRMNVGKLESRMIWRKLDRDGLVKSFMEDEGRQRTTKFISYKCANVSDQLQLFAKEQERSKLLCSSAPHGLDAEPASLKTPPSSTAADSKSCKTPTAKRRKKADGSRSKDAEQGQQAAGDHTEDGLEDKPDEMSGDVNERCEEKTAEEEDKTPATPIAQSTQSETPSCSGSITITKPDSDSVPTPGEIPIKENKGPNLAPQIEADNPASIKIVEVDNVFQPQRTHETYRLLKRRNMIVEAVRSAKILEGFFPLQKIINEAEKQDGVSSKCCKKSVLRLVQSLSREGLLKLYTTTVIQDGVTKKVDIVVHPSIQPNDERVNQLINQIRFRISSSYAAGRLQVAEQKGEQQLENPATSKGNKRKALKKMLETDENTNFKPTPVPGLGKTLGFQPKMIRLRVIHSFLWYMVYGHPLRENRSESVSANQTPGEAVSSGPDAQLPESERKQAMRETETSNPSLIEEGSGDEEGLQGDKSKPDLSDSDMKVYADEVSWRRFIPPLPLYKGFSSGWAILRDLLLCLPLSIFVQIVQINYKVDELEDYLGDSVKQHYLVRALPARMKRQLLFKRKYIFVFHENLQKLIYMGLVQFGVNERFKDKDQVFIYVKRNASIVDTTTSDPHYWLVQEPPDNPFERRHYTFNTTEDVESFWFDLMCVCLNTPLGVIRCKRNGSDDDSAPPFVHDHNVIVGMGYLLKGSYEVCDDGCLPGDGRGAGGLDSELFSHLKRNWLWTSHLLASKSKLKDSEAPDTKMRLKSLLSKSSLRMALQAGNNLTPHYLTNKQPVITENIQVGIEPASRNKQVVGGKGQRRKRKKKEVVRVLRKRKEPKKRTRAHDATDHQALKRMTRHRVYWSVQEDSVMMLCSVAAHLLNSKLQRPFVPHCVVRDLLHAEFDISKDKTSLAVGRRSRYILKNPQTLLNYRICLAEVHQDKALMSLLEEKKPANPDQAEDCAKAFHEYARLLRQKFSNVMCDHDLIIPDSQEEIFARFKVSAIDSGQQLPSKDTINCREDIHAIVLQNLIQSSLAMNNGQMKYNRSFQTFHTYSKYNQELLCRVFVQSKNKRLFNRRRISKSLEPKKNRGLPILPMSFQMSQTYYRYFSWRFQYSLCTESFFFLRKLITSGRGDDRPVTAFYHETENRSLTGEGTCDRKTARKGKHNFVKESGIQTAGGESTDKVDAKSSLQGGEKLKEPEEKIANIEESIALDGQKSEEMDQNTEEKIALDGQKSEEMEKNTEKIALDGQKSEEMDQNTEEKIALDGQKSEEMDQNTEEKIALEGQKSDEMEKNTKEKIALDGQKSEEMDQNTEDKIALDGQKFEEMDQNTEEKIALDGQKSEEMENTEEIPLDGQKSEEMEQNTEEIALDMQKNPECSAQSGAADVSLRGNQTDDNLPGESAEAGAASDTPAEASQDLPDLSDMLEFPLSSPGGACVVSLSLMTLGLLSVHVSIPKQIVMVDSSLVDNNVVKSMATLEQEDDDDDDDDDESDGKKRLQVTAHQASHTNYLLMRGYCAPGIVKLRNLNTNDNIVVESCIIKLRLRDSPAHRLFVEENAPPLELTKYGPSLMPSILTSQIRSPSFSPPSPEECDERFAQDRAYTVQDIEACARLRGSLRDAGEKGLDERDLYSFDLQQAQSGRTRSLPQYLKDLQEEGQVVRVGGLGARWVLMEHAEPWLLTVSCKQMFQSLPMTDRRPFLRTHHNIPFARKRYSREVHHQAKGPPAKKPATDGEKLTESETVGGKSTEDVHQEQRKDETDYGGRASLSLEGEQEQTQPERGEEHAEQQKTEGDQGRGRSQRIRKRLLEEKVEAAGSIPSGSADTEENLTFISRPWRFIDGKVNRPVCKGIVEAVLYHIMSQPGLTQQALLEHYKDALQPAAVMDVVQALLDLGCITKKTLVKDPKPSLFKRSAATHRESASMMMMMIEEPDAVYYEPTISCCLRLCRLLPHERHWNECLT